jgi:hypothetical protein
VIKSLILSKIGCIRLNHRGERLWNAKEKKTEKSATVPMNPVKKKEFAVTVFTITEKEENYLPAISLLMLRLPMTEV